MRLIKVMFNLLFKMSFYAVAKGRKVGIFGTWAECESNVKGFSGAVFKKFKSNDEARNFISIKSNNVSSKAIVEPPSKRQKCDMTEEEMLKIVLNCDLNNEPEPIKKPRKSRGAAGSSRKTNDDTFKPDRIRMIKPEETTLKTYGGHQFHEDKEGFVHVYTDGSCENNGKKGAIAGLGVYFGDNHPLNAADPVRGRATNNSGEIQAAIKAIEDAQTAGIKRLNIFTDSQFVINSVCKWMSAWKAKDWKLSSGKPVVNRVDFKRLDQLIESGNMLIKWSYIAAHRGHAGNEEADRLAKEGAQKSLKVNQ